MAKLAHAPLPTYYHKVINKLDQLAIHKDIVANILSDKCKFHKNDIDVDYIEMSNIFIELSIIFILLDKEVDFNNSRILSEATKIWRNTFPKIKNKLSKSTRVLPGDIVVIRECIFNKLSEDDDLPAIHQILLQQISSAEYRLGSYPLDTPRRSPHTIYSPEYNRYHTPFHDSDAYLYS